MCGDGLAPSVAHVHELIDAQIASGLPAERILVGGFSHGSPARRLHWQCSTSAPAPSQGHAWRLWAARHSPRRGVHTPTGLPRLPATASGTGALAAFKPPIPPALTIQAGCRPRRVGRR